MGEQEVVTEEPTSLQLPIEATTKIQEATVETREDFDIETQVGVVTQERTPSQMVVEVDRNGFQEEDVVT